MNCRGLLRVVEKPVVMGIINVTPDSFFEGSRRMDPEAVLSLAEKMLAAGASILDIGGQSTKPGAKRIGANEEMDRVLPAVETIHRNFPDAWISIDTFYASVAEAAIEAGAGMVNDISAGSIDDNLLPCVARMKVPYVCMHMQGDPEHMQTAPHYNHVTQEVLDFLIRRTAFCRSSGIQDIIIDPGFGFGKTIAHNFTLLRELAAFRMLGLPILAGLSRKSTIYRTLGCSAEEALNGTTVLNTLALLNGATILRVHDVKEAAEAITLVEAYKTT